MNILHVLPWESFGGVPNYVRGLLKGLKILGHRNVCVGLDRCLEAYRRYCDVYVVVEDRLCKIPRITKIYLYQVFKLDFSRVLGETDVDSVIINNDPRVIPLNDVVKLSIPIIRVQHGTYMNYLYWYRHLPVPAIDSIKELSHTLLYHYDILRCLRKASRLYPNFYVVAVSEHTRKELIYYGVPSNKIYVVTGGVDKNIFKPLPKDKVRNTLNNLLGARLGENDEVILHVGSSPRKGTHILLKALKMLTNLGKVKTIIVGSLKGSYGRCLLNLIMENALHRKVLLLSKVPNDLMPLLYNAADIVVQPSYSEGCPLTLLESLTCGTPVITTNVGCNEYFFSLVKCKELLVRMSGPDFADELAKKIVYSLENKEYLRKKVLINAKYVPSWRDVASKYIDIIRT